MLSCILLSNIVMMGHMCCRCFTAAAAAAAKSGSRLHRAAHAAPALWAEPQRRPKQPGWQESRASRCLHECFLLCEPHAGAHMY